ncbi:malonate decarboxylase holo-[acyl-carrier-protein] synthase [Bradyrhizobium sp. ARR65]|uniref:malonate decarboxylase holo-[acyl-carrier-protein] synthase n=1 Tax=Bradyrhizobium sp. ARR65 TaxID=1040989 RepID=UPI001FD8A930|nr:malonate decarboxylase holo-[acyl-carrier-protein] synthase [Bradyrhizobium sp. ARR65]
MAEALARHTMVKASAAGWAAAMNRYPELASEPLVAGWAHAGRPLVVRRPARSDTAGLVPLGLPLPPSHGKRRIAISLAAVDIVAAAPPPLLAEAAAAAPASWRATIDRLVQLLPETRVYGSVAWQHLTGLPYLSDSSDLDLLAPLRPAHTLRHLSWQAPTLHDLAAQLLALGPRHLEPTERVLKSITFGFSDANHLFYDWGTFGSIFEDRKLSFGQRREILRGMKQRPRHRKRGGWLRLYYHWDRGPIVETNCGLGKISVWNATSGKFPSPNGIELRNNVRVTLEFGSPVDFDAALRAMYQMVSLFELTAQAQQDIEGINLQHVHAEETEVPLSLHVMNAGRRKAEKLHPTDALTSRAALAFLYASCAPRTGGQCEGAAPTQGMGKFERRQVLGDRRQSMSRYKRCGYRRDSGERIRGRNRARLRHSCRHVALRSYCRRSRLCRRSKGPA